MNIHYFLFIQLKKNNDTIKINNLYYYRTITVLLIVHIFFSELQECYPESLVQKTWRRNCGWNPDERRDLNEKR